MSKSRRAKNWQRGNFRNARASHGSLSLSPQEKQLKRANLVKLKNYYYIIITKIVILFDQVQSSSMMKMNEIELFTSLFLLPIQAFHKKSIIQHWVLSPNLRRIFPPILFDKSVL